MQTIKGPNFGSTLYVPDLSDSAFQQTRANDVRAQLIRACERSWIYREKFQELHVDPHGIDSWEKFRQLRLKINKEDERRDQERSRREQGHPYGSMLLADPKDVVAITSTSGTTGLPIFSYPYTRKDLDINSDCWQRAMTWMGVERGERIVNVFGLSMNPVGTPAVAALWLAGHQCIPIGAEIGSERILRMMDIVRPACLVGTPSLVGYLIERSRDVIGKPVGDLGVRVIMVAGEPGGGIPEVRQNLADAYGATIYDSQIDSHIGVAMSCNSKDYHGLHDITPDIASRSEDIISPENGEPIPLENGAKGVVLKTSLKHWARPAIKMFSGDMIQLFTEPCECGFRGIRYRIFGRVDDMLIIKGVNLFPNAIKGVIENFLPETTGHFRVLLDAPPPLVKPPLKLRVEAGKDITESAHASLAQRIAERMHGDFKVRPVVELVQAGTLERSVGKTKYIQIVSGEE